MASKVSDLLKIYGRQDYEAGAHMYHAADGVGPSGAVSGEQQHRIRKALRKLRLRASGMTDDILGSKEVSGIQNNPFEQEPKE
jgi:hypothetical protein